MKYTEVTETTTAGSMLGWTLLLLLVAIAQPSVAWAQNNVAVPYEAAAAYNAYNANFLVQSGGQTYYNTELNSVGTSESGTWVSALDILVAEDNYEATHSPATQQLVSALLNSFESYNGTNWSYDGWNDDVGWMVNAFVRGYQITGNTGYLTVAENNYNMAYSRGWDTSKGGIWENTDEQTKCALSNDPFVWEGVGIYEATGNSTYLTDAENIYNWARTTIFNSSNSSNSLGAPGQVNEGITSSGSLQPSDNVYNSGSFLEAANALHQITGNSEYYNDAILDINHVIGNGPILHSTAEAPGSQWAYWFVKGLSDFCTDNNVWPTYYPYMLANANAAWTERNGSDLTWNDWTSPTNASGTDALEMMSAAAIWQLIDIPQQYQIINENSGLAMDLISGNEANDAVIEQWSPNSGDANQQWMLVQLSNGNYGIVSSLTNEAASISAASTSNGAQLVDWPYSTTDTSQQFSLISEGNGWYYIKNVNSGLVLDDSGGGTSNGTEIVQWGANGGTNQMWKLQAITSFGGNYEISCVSSGLATDVSGESTANGASVIQFPYGGGSNQLWNFIPTNFGYYQIRNVNSGLDLNVSGASTANGGKIVQWQFGFQGNDQWAPVKNSDGSFTFYNLFSGLVLDNPGGTTQAAQLDQWGINGGNNQEFDLTSR